MVDGKLRVGRNMRGRVEGLCAIITGGSRGIGRATAIALGREGAKVVVNYRIMSKEAEEVVNSIKRGGGEAFSFQADVANRDAVQRMVDEAVKRFGGVDILVNNAGIVKGSAPFLELREEDLNAMIDTNVKGILFDIRQSASLIPLQNPLGFYPLKE